MMDRATSLEHFLRQPVGHWVEGPSYIAWSASPQLVGVSSFGQRTQQDSIDVVKIFGTLAHPQFTPPVRVVLDYRRLQSIAPESFAMMAAFMRDSNPMLMTRLDALIMLVVPSQTGAVVAGMLNMLGYTLPTRIYGTESEALPWLGASGLAAVEAVEELVAQRDGRRDLLNQIRRLLREEPRGASLQRVARKLAVSGRTAQRALTEAGSTFTREVQAARAALAAQRLEESADKIHAIAAEVGCSSTSHLGVLFRRFYLMSPAEYRAARRPKESPE